MVILVRLRYLADIFSKNEQRKSLSLQEKQVAVFVDIQNWSFQVEIGILENFYLPLGAWQLPNTLGLFS